MAYIPAVYRDQGGDRITIASGGTLRIQDGATHTVGDDVALTFGDDSDGSITYDETTNDELVVACTSTTFRADGSSSELELVDGRVRIPDDIPFTLGDDNDATLTYDEAGDNRLEVACAGGLIFFADGSSSELEIVDGRVRVPDDIPLTFGGDNDITLTYDEAGENRLEVAGSGVWFSVGGTVGELEILSSRVRVADDIPLTLGNDNDATLMYDETTDNILEIAAANGINIAADGSSTELEIRNARVRVPDDIPLTLGSDNDVTLTYDEAGQNRLEVAGSGVWFAVDGSSSELELSDGQVTMSQLPTSDPVSSGRLWKHGDLLKVST